MIDKQNDKMKENELNTSDAKLVLVWFDFQLPARQSNIYFN